MHKALILGSSGLVGSSLAQSDDHFICSQISFKDIKSLDTYLGLIQQEIRFHSVSSIINCVGCTDVALCQSNPDFSREINFELPVKLAMLCQDNGIRMIHFSSDYVFSGTSEMYFENSNMDPICIYGIHKVEADEKLVHHNMVTIIRPGLIFGSHPSVRDVSCTFVPTQQPLYLDNSRLKYPIYANDLRSAIIFISNHNDYFISKRLLHFGQNNCRTKFQMAHQLTTARNGNIKLLFQKSEPSFPPKPKEVNLKSSYASIHNMISWETFLQNEVIARR